MVIAVVTVLFFHLFESPKAVAQPPPINEPAGVSRAVGAGRWESVQDAGEKRDWQIQVERYDDGAIEGSIVVVGSPYLHKARLEGRVDGKEVYGVLLGDGEKQVGTFAGTVGDTGLSGTYRTEHGDSGNWSWPGPAAAQSMNEERSIKEEKTD
jgi:hypothetical protein